MTVWQDFRENFPDIGHDPDMRGYELINKVLFWASRWPKHVWTQVVNDSFATVSLLVFIKSDNDPLPGQTTIELVVIPQNANLPTMITISRPKETMAILVAILGD